MSIELDRPEPDYLGLPVLNYMEGEYLKLRTDPEICEGTVPISYIGDMVVRSISELDEVIAHDIRQYKEYDAHHDVLDEQRDLFADGIREGYVFFIGCMTWISMVRRNESDILAFIQNNSGPPVIPSISAAALARIKQVRAGAAPLEFGVSLEAVESSKDLSFTDADEYCIMSEPFEDVLIIYTDELSDFPDKKEDPYVSGVLHGVANAIEMYMQLHEESVLANARSA